MESIALHEAALSVQRQGGTAFDCARSLATIGLLRKGLGMAGVGGVPLVEQGIPALSEARALFISAGKPQDAAVMEDNMREATIWLSTQKRGFRRWFL